MSEHTPFLTMFPGCEDMSNACGGLDRPMSPMCR